MSGHPAGSAQRKVRSPYIVFMGCTFAKGNITPKSLLPLHLLRGDGLVLSRWCCEEHGSSRAAEPGYRCSLHSDFSPAVR